MAAPRRQAREAVLLSLYEMDVAAHDPSEVLERLIRERRLKQDLPDFARLLLTGVLEKRGEIDALIERAAPAWPADQLSPIDRNILRVAIREFLVDNLTPVGAAINEAVEMAKKFGSESSGRFINGVLGTLAPEKAAVQEGE
jgi:transcription antitermination protein NusB